MCRARTDGGRYLVSRGREDLRTDDLHEAFMKMIEYAIDYGETSWVEDLQETVDDGGKVVAVAKGEDPRNAYGWVSVQYTEDEGTIADWLNEN